MVNASPDLSGSLSQGTGIIIALDVDSLSAALALISQTNSAPGVAGYKLGPGIALTKGLGTVVSRIREITDHALIYDHQKAGLDIPSNAAHFAETLASSGINAAIVFPLAGPTTAIAFLEALRARAITPILGGTLPLADFHSRTGGWVSESALPDIARLSAERGYLDLVVPASNAIAEVLDVVEHTSPAKPRLFIPGITSAGAELEFLAGAGDRVEGAFAIVGRAVTTAADPAQVVERLSSRLADALSRKVSHR